MHNSITFYRTTCTAVAAMFFWCPSNTFYTFIHSTHLPQPTHLVPRQSLNHRVSHSPCCRFRSCWSTPIPMPLPIFSLDPNLGTLVNPCSATPTLDWHVPNQCVNAVPPMLVLSPTRSG